MNALRTSVLLLAIGTALSTSRAQDGFRGWDRIKDPDFVFNPDRREFRNYQVGRGPRVRELLDQYETLLAERAVVPALRHLQELLDEHGASVLQVSNVRNNERYVGAAEHARWLLLQARPEVLAAYERLAELNGRDALERARAEGDAFELNSLARRYVNALVGKEALIALARLDRERGARRVAAFRARRLLDFIDESASGDEATRRKVAAIGAEARAIAALGDGTTAGLLGDAAASAEVEVEGTAQPLARFLSTAKLEPPFMSADVWPTYGGDATRARPSLGPLRELDLGRTFTLEVEHVRYPNDRSPLAGMRHAPIQPIRIGDRLYVNNSLSVRCFDLLSRSLAWEYEGAQARVLGRDDDGFLAVADYDPSNGYDDPTWAKGLVVGLSAAEGVVLANLQVPQAANVKVHQGFRINDPCRWRGLVALDARDGELLWEQRPLVRDEISENLEYAELRRRGDPDAVLPRLDVPGPPAIVDDVVFALGHFFEGAVNTYAVALELKSGEPLWSVPLVIGQQELSMFNMPFQEFTTGSPSFWNGTLYCPTNVGLVAAVDATFGDLRWLSAYEALKINAPDNYFRNRPRPVYWYSRGPLVGDDLLLVTPHDSRNLVSLDPATGKERFSRELPGHDTWYPNSHLIGRIGERIYVATGGSVIAIGVNDARLAWQYPSSTRGARPIELLGTGVVTEKRIWLPTPDELVVLEDGGTHAIEVERTSWDADEPKNLLLFPDMLVASGKTRVTVAFDPAEALRELRNDVERIGESADLLARIGSLERQAGDLAQAAKTLRRALELENTGDRAEAARVRATLCSTLRDLADAERRAGRAPASEAALVEAETVADDAETRAAIVQELLEGSAEDAADERAIRWLTRIREDFATSRVAVPGLSPRSVTVAIWVGLELARRREQRGELDQALTELQRVQTDWPSEPLAERDSVALAQAAVDGLLTRAPPELRRKYDADAKEAFAAAVEAGDVERLALLLRRFPSAASAPEFAARELELLRANRRPIEALVVGAEILRARPDEMLARAATAELARAAREVGNVTLARALVRRLALAPEGAVPEDLGPLAETPAPRELEGTLDFVRDLDLDDNVVVMGGTAEYPLRGEPLPDGFESVILREQGLDLKLARMRLADGERQWEAILPRPRQSDFMPQVVHVAGTLVARRGSLLIALDLETGAELWQKEFERNVSELSTAAGVLLFTQFTPPREGAESEPVDLVFVEPRTGRQLAVVPLAGTDVRVGTLQGVGSSCVTTTYLPSGPAVEVFDAITGARQLDPHGYAHQGVPPLLLPGPDLLVLPDSRPAGGEFGARTGGIQSLHALRLLGGEKLFSVDLLPLAFKLRYLYAVADGFAAFGGTSPEAKLETRVMVVDPRTGAPKGPPTPLPKDVNDRWMRATVLGEEQMVRVMGFSDWHQGDPAMTFVLLAGDGRELWRKSFELPKNTVQVLRPDRILRRGKALVLAMQLQASGKYRTEVIALDEVDGTVLMRRGFDGGRTTVRDDLVRIDDFVALRQDKTLHVLGWR